MQTQLYLPSETFALRLWTERIKEEGAQMRSSLSTTLSNTHTLQLCEGRRRHVPPPGSSVPREALNDCLSKITQGPEWRPLPCAFHGSAGLRGRGWWWGFAIRQIQKRKTDPASGSRKGELPRLAPCMNLRMASHSCPVGFPGSPPLQSCPQCQQGEISVSSWKTKPLVKLINEMK